ncbi:MAG: hypothetical protein DI551_08805 [Micavibrio aeruginosavorus]|uniref:Transglycosylase SLT domain-containing protein n=1 Tax=Micavibrio aeruginosavorus TaxID=349221 RepID=A0A2W5PR73_9BACT|nr:MAG: hypothetical protein DI551_08805 [Micavibrio aeruginosavorus]
MAAITDNKPKTDQQRKPSFIAPDSSWSQWFNAFQQQQIAQFTSAQPLLQGVTGERLINSDIETIKNTQQELSEAGLYPPEGHSYYRDGKVGEVTQHALKLVNDPNYAAEYMKTALKDDDMRPAEIMKLQATLNRLGYAAGDVDGRLDKDSRAALQAYLKDNPNVEKGLSQSERDIAQRPGGLDGVVDSVMNTVRDVAHSFSGHTVSGHTEINPDLAARMAKDPTVRHYVDLTREAAARNGLDGNMLANQYWQESKFDPGAISPAGARGIAQFIPSTGDDYGLNNRGDLHNAEKSIEAGARHMADLSRKLGSQELALVAYNGGKGAVDFVRGKLGGGEISAHNWMQFMNERRENSPSSKAGAWQNETYNYVRIITGMTGRETQVAETRPQDKPTQVASNNAPSFQQPAKQNGETMDQAGQRLALNNSFSQQAQGGILDTAKDYMAGISNTVSNTWKHAFG